MTTAIGSKTKKIPRKALHFSASMDLADPGADVDGANGVLPPRSVTIRARTSGEAYQGFWGRCVHDMSGFIPPDGPLSLNYDHCSDEIVGVADTCQVIDGDLVADSRLIPFAPFDRASEIITKGAAGVPYQASVELDIANLWVEEVADGQTVDVNGGTFTGPGAVFRQWGITGLAVLSSGADSDTSVEFAAGNSDVDVLILPAVQEKPMLDPSTSPAVSVQEQIDAALKAQREEATRFMTDFGSAGAQWHFEGKSYPEAARLFSAQLQTQIETLKAEHKVALDARDASITALTTERDELKSKLEFRRGHPQPVPNKPSDATAVDKRSAMQKLTDSIAARLPKPSSN